MVAASRKRKAEAKLSPDALKCPDPRVSRAAANAWLIKRGLPTGDEKIDEQQAKYAQAMAEKRAREPEA